MANSTAAYRMQPYDGDATVYYPILFLVSVGMLPANRGGRSLDGDLLTVLVSVRTLLRLKFWHFPSPSPRSEQGTLDPLDMNCPATFPL